MFPFEPESLPLKDLDYGRLIGPAGRANAAPARYDGLLQSLVNPAIMLSPAMITNEAVLSSRIEGTQATLEDVLEFDAGQSATGALLLDIQEVINYRSALQACILHLKDYPITIGMIREAHRILLLDVQGLEQVCVSHMDHNTPTVSSNPFRETQKGLCLTHETRQRIDERLFC